MANRVLILLLSILISSVLVINNNNCCSATPSSKEEKDLEEDLSILLGDEEAPVSDVSPSSSPAQPQFNEDDDDDDFNGSVADHDSLSSSQSVDENEDSVVILKEKNFSDFVMNNNYAMVEFYAPWCGHCQTLAPEYAAAAIELKGEIAFGKVDVTEENALAQQYEVEGLPTLFFFIDGIHRPYTGQRTKDGIVAWVKKKTGPGVYNITTTEDAEHIMNTEERFIVCFLDSLVGPESKVLADVSKLGDDVEFYQTASPEVAKLFHIDPKAKCPALVLLKKEAEKLSHFNGLFIKSAITDFVAVNKLPLVTTFSKESAPLIFSSPIKKQILLFATSHDSVKVLPVAEEAAKFFKGKLVFIYVETDDKEVGRPVSEYFGATGDDPKAIAYEGHDDGRKFLFDSEVTLDNIKAFGKAFLGNKLMPFYKSAPVPENNDGDLKIVVKDNFDEIVLDESKDVFLEIYAPWCKHCQELEPILNKLAKHLHDIGSIVIAKMDGTTNEHPRIKIDGFPILLFFPAGNKSSDPIFVDTDRTIVALYTFLKKHASIPFKLQKLDSLQEAEVSKTKESSTDDDDDMKDELFPTSFSSSSTSFQSSLLLTSSSSSSSSQQVSIPLAVHSWLNLDRRRFPSSGKYGIQQQSRWNQLLLAAEQEAQQIVNSARNDKMTRLKQAKEEAAKEIARYRAETEAEFQRKVTESSGDSGTNVKRLEQETEDKIHHLKADSASISHDVVNLLLKLVTTVNK